MYLTPFFILICIHAYQAAVIPRKIAGNHSPLGDLESEYIGGSEVVTSDGAVAPLSGFTHVSTSTDSHTIGDSTATSTDAQAWKASQQPYKGPNFLIAYQSGTVKVCSLDSPEKCYTLYKTDEKITAITATGKFFYLGLRYGEVLRCQLEELDSCQSWCMREGSINALTVYEESIYIGLGTGVMLRCPANQECSCTRVNNAGGVEIHALTSARSEDFQQVFHYIYAGLQSGVMWRCAAYTENNCKPFNAFGAPIISITASENNENAFAGVSSYGLLRYKTSNMNGGEPFEKPQYDVNALSIFKEYVYLGLSNGVMRRCLVMNKTSCIDVHNYEHKFSFIVF